MRIIKINKLKKKDFDIGVIDCPKCHTEFEFERDESDIVSKSDLVVDEIYVVKCPQCNGRIIFSGIIFKQKISE
jgi:uncharacterized protein (UPF0212 family)